MNLYRYTEMLYTAYLLAFLLGYFAVIIYSSKTWWGRSNLISIAYWIRSRPVSVTAQKYAGIYTHPICSVDGTTNSIGLPVGSGIIYEKLHLRSSSTRIIQNPSDRLILVIMVIYSVPTKLMKWRRWWKMLTISLNATSCARRYIVLLTLPWIRYAHFLTRPG